MDLHFLTDDFAGFGYPFAVYDLETLQISRLLPTTAPSPKPLTHSVKGEDAHITSQIAEDDKLSVKVEPESEIDEDNLVDQEDDALSSGENSNDSDYKPSPSKKTGKSVQKASGTGTKKKSKEFITKYDDIYNFVKDPITNRFHCTWANCSKSYVDRYELLFHTDRHRGTPRKKCDQCPMAFYVTKQLDRHIQVVHEEGKTKKPFECKLCGKRYSSKNGLYNHNTYSHSTKAVGWKICEFVERG